MAEGYCDVSTAGGGWQVIRRRDKLYSTNFCRGWMEYVDGFGDLNKEFWYGLKLIYCLTNQGKGSYMLTLHLKMVQHPIFSINILKSSKRLTIINSAYLDLLELLLLTYFLSMY